MFKYPIKLNDRYTCQGTDADGKPVVYDDLLAEGDCVGFGDRDENVFVDAHVVRRSDGLWVEALSEHPASPVAPTARARRDQVEHNEFAQSEGG